MDVEAFISWALAEARTLEQRFTVELMVHNGLRAWHWKRKNYQYQSPEYSAEYRREQTLNPAYLPKYSETTLRQACEGIAQWKDWSIYGDRPVRDISALAFLPGLESLNLGMKTDISDLSPLAALPRLHTLTLGYSGSLHGQKSCEDYTPLGRCTSLHTLTLSFAANWPDLTGLDQLTALTTLHLTGNLLALPRGICFPNVHHAGLYCMPLGMRDMRDMPDLPACQFLTLHGAGTLRGIEKMPLLRNLKLVGAFKSYEALTALTHLSSLVVEPDRPNDLLEHPRDLTPINRIPALLFFQYGRRIIGFDMPNDYSQLTDSPSLREILVQGCPHVDMEVASVNAGLPSWDDLFLRTEPLTLPPMQFVIAPEKAFEGDLGPENPPDPWEFPDEMILSCQNRWVARLVEQSITQQIGHSDWGHVDTAYSGPRCFGVKIESYETVERLPEILETTRHCMARLLHRHKVTFWIQLRIPPPEPSAAMKELEAELRRRQNQWESDNRHRERIEYTRLLHRKELLEQEGAAIDPDDFSPEAQPPYPQMEDLIDEKEDDDDEGDIAIQTEYKNTSFFEDEHEHPMADAYDLMGDLFLDAARFRPHNRDIAIHLMARQPDIDIPDPPKETEPA